MLLEHYLVSVLSITDNLRLFLVEIANRLKWTGMELFFPCLQSFRLSFLLNLARIQEEWEGKGGGGLAGVVRWVWNAEVAIFYWRPRACSAEIKWKFAAKYFTNFKVSKQTHFSSMRNHLFVYQPLTNLTDSPPPAFLTPPPPPVSSLSKPCICPW